MNGIVSNNASGAISAGYVVRVGARRAARLRLCSGSTQYHFEVSIERHNMTVVAKDGALVKPVEVSRVTVYPGERYDVLVAASATPGDYAIKFRAPAHATAVLQIHGSVNATLRVAPASRADARAPAGALRALPDAPFVGALDLGAVPAYGGGDDELLRADMRRVAGGGARVPRVATRTLPLAMTARYPFDQQDEARIDDAPIGMSTTSAWLINDVAWADPSAPLYLTKNRCCAYESARASDDADDGAPSYATHVIDVDYGEVVDLVVTVGIGAPSTIVHSLHLHGYRFWVVATGPLPFPEGGVDASEQLNLDDPLLADTLPITVGRYYVLRFVADNPGWWHLHCHLLFHMEEGLQLALNVAEDRQPEPPQAYYDGQESWPGEFNSLRSSLDERRSTSAGEAAPALRARRLRGPRDRRP